MNIMTQKREGKRGQENGDVSQFRCSTRNWETSPFSLLLLVGGVGRRRAEEQRFSVRQRDVAAVRAKGAILRLIAVDEDLRSRFQGILCEAASQQRVWRA